MDLKDYCLLTIIVPTWNRCNVLAESLAHNLKMASSYFTEVRFFVSDNASDDNTKEVVSKLMHEYPENLFYHRNNKNIGAQENFKYGVANVNSKYVCLLGDEELLSPVFFHFILSAIKSRENYAVIHYNFLIGTIDSKDCHLFNKDMVSGYVKEYPSGKEFIYDMLNSPTLMSSNVFLRDYWMQSVDKEVDAPGYSWFSILCYASLLGKCLYCSFPLLEQRVSEINDYKEKYTWYSVYGLSYLFDILNKDIPGILHHWQEKTQIENRGFIVGYMMHMALYKNFYKPRYKKYIQKYILDEKVDMLAKLSLHLPYNVVKKIFNIYCKMRTII